MRIPTCLKCQTEQELGPKLRRAGHYYRTSDSKWVQRFSCRICQATYSTATFSHCYRQKKRRKNFKVFELLSSKNSLNRVAKILNLNRKTVVRTFQNRSLWARYKNRELNFSRPKALIVEFDDLETFELTKCKPISVTLAVESQTRRILGFEVSTMAANGMLAEKSKRLYGPRLDGRKAARKRLFKQIAPLVAEGALIKSDDNPHYPRCVKRYFPKSKHIRYAGKRGSSTGQGELKKVRFDPIFSLNHTCAMLRDNVSRLIRKTWCTTKRIDRLEEHLCLYAYYHNRYLLKTVGEIAA